MESVHHEQQLVLPVVKTVRDRIVAFHDRYLSAAPIADDAVAAFEDIVKRMTSKKGQAAIERIRPHVADWSKNAEVWASAGDMVLTVAGSAVAIDALFLEKHRIKNMAGSLDGANQATGASELNIAARSRVKRGFAAAALAGVFGGLRPVTHLVHRVGIPIARRIAGAVDGILLRKEQKQEVQQVFVGRGKA